MTQAIASIRKTPAKVPKPGEDEISLALDTDRFDQMQRIARVMSNGSLLPDHLVVRPFWATNKKGAIHPAEYKSARKDFGVDVFDQSLKDAATRTMANCFRVVNQAFRWKFDPFSIIDKTYSVGDGKLSYEGQLVAAVVNTRAGIKGRLKYSYTGREFSDERTITVSATFLDEDEPRSVEVNVGRAKTKNEIWRTDPDQKLVYTGSIKWARRFCPELMLGVLTDDDLERMQMRVVEITPAAVPQVDKMIEGAGQADPPTEAAPEPESPEPEAPEPSGQAGLDLDAKSQDSAATSLTYLEAEIDKGMPEKHATACLLAHGLIHKGESWSDLKPETLVEAVQDALAEVE